MALRAAPPRWRCACAALCAWIAALAGVTPVRAEADIRFPAPNPSAPLQFSAATASEQPQGAGMLWHLRDNVRLAQGEVAVACREALLWSEPIDDSRQKVRIYAIGAVQLSDSRGAVRAELGEQAWLGPYVTPRLDAEVQEVVPATEATQQLIRRAEQPIAAATPAAHQQPARLAQSIHRTEFQPGGGPPAALPRGTRRVRIFRRSNVPIEAQWLPPTPTGEQTAVIHSGVNIVIDGLMAGSPGLQQFATAIRSGPGTVDILADRVVIWTAGLQPDFGGQAVQAEDVPLEIYLEGNIVFRQGELTVFADRMYYDARHQVGTVLKAEALTPIPGRQGLGRLKADVLQQVGPGRYQATNAFFTTSRMGRPGYRLQSREIYFEDLQQFIDDPLSGAPLLDPQTAEPVVEHQQRVTANNNLVFIGSAPVFYWPTFATDVRDPTFFIQGVQVKNDRIFGTQILTDWNAYQLLGIKNPPPGTKWSVSADYLSERGFGYGSGFRYQGIDLPVLKGPYFGFIDGWAINDRGLDNLGRTQDNLLPPEPYRYRILARHRQTLPNNWQLTGEFGQISDLNFLPQYFENEWDEFKDESTGFELKRTLDIRSYSISSDVRTNGFVTDTQFLPRLDHFWVGQSLLGDRLTWYEHSSVAYAKMLTASTPFNPQQQANFALLPWEVDAEGARAATRQSLELPVTAGPFKVVPYAVGELGYWGQDINFEQTDRAYGQAGVRVSLPLWAVNPAVESTLYNVHGVAHKAVFEIDASLADANRDVDQFPLYDPIDDDNITNYRRRTAFLDFTGTIPPQFDARSVALRMGAGGWVTSPSTELADDMATVRFGVRQRWQTKRGLPGQRRIIDWIVFDTNAVYFPDDDRDNFGEPFGLVTYNFRWHVGDRVTLVSGGQYDFFYQGLQATTFGMFLNRPPRGNLFLGYRRLDGPFTVDIVQFSYSYRMSPKWISAFGTSFDLGPQGNIGQQFTLTRIGESFLVSVSVNVDSSKDNVGVGFAIEPRFLSGYRFGTGSGASGVPLAGLERLE